MVTQSDLLPRVILAGFDLARPIGELMTANPHQLPASASAYDAALEMATHGVRHLLVVNSDSVLLGVVSERDLFSLQRISLRQIRAGIDNAADIAALQRASKDIRQLALNLIAQGIGAEQLTQFISALNDALTRRIIVLARERHDLVGIDFAWFAFGSEGRHEQTLSTDQDNGIIFRCRQTEAAQGNDAPAPARVCPDGQRRPRRLRLPAVQGQHHGEQPRAVPDARRVEVALRRLDPRARPAGAAQRVDLLRLPRALRQRALRRPVAQRAQPGRQGQQRLPAHDGGQRASRSCPRSDASATSWSRTTARST